MKFIKNIPARAGAFKKIRNSLKPGKAVCATGLSEIHKSILIYSVCRFNNVRAFCVAQDEQKAQTVTNDLCSMGLRALFYQSRDFIFREVNGISREYEHQRLNVLYKMLRGEYDVVVSCLDAASQFTVPRDVLESSVLNLRVGTEVSTDFCIKALTLLGYQRFDQVDGKGQFSLRGGILDFFMPDSDNPVRAEFWGDEITDLNYFDIETQRRIEKAEEIILTPSAEIIIEDKDTLADRIQKKALHLTADNQQKAKEILLREAARIRDGLTISSIDKFIGEVYEKPSTMLDYLDRDSLVFVSEYNNVRERAKAYDFQFGENLSDYFADGTLCRGFENYYLDFNSSIELLRRHPMLFMDVFAGSGYDIPLDELVSFSAKQLGLWNGSIKYVSEDIDNYMDAGFSVVILAGTKKSAENLYENLLNENWRTSDLDAAFGKDLIGVFYNRFDFNLMPMDTVYLEVYYHSYRQDSYHIEELDEFMKGHYQWELEYAKNDEEREEIEKYLSPRAVGDYYVQVSPYDYRVEEEPLKEGKVRCVKN
jgi:transcription-repair coupling factor (superfamily II helicase)